jgi:integrase
LHARERADELGHTEEEHYLWCASQHHHHDPTKPAKKWDGAWRSLRDAAGLPGFRFHDLRHTVVTDLLEAGEPEHVIQAVTGPLSKKMLEHTHTSGSRQRSDAWADGVRRTKGTD